MRTHPWNRDDDSNDVRGLRPFRWTAVLSAVLGLALAGLAPASAGKAKEWVVSPLPMQSGWAGCFANDVNDSGLVVGGWVDEDGAYHAAYWEDGTAHDLEGELGVPDGFEAVGSNVLAANSHGLLAGSATNADGIQIAVMWDVTKGTVRSLNPSDDLLASALWSVNASGAACGYAVEPTDDGFSVKPHVWPKGDDAGMGLPLGEWRDGYANGINSSGVVAGMMGNWGGPWQAAVWTRDGKGDYQVTDLGAEFEEEVYYSQAFDVAEDGTVVGHAFDGSEYFAWAWTAKGGMTRLDDDGRGEGIAWKTNGNYVAGGVGYWLWDEVACVWHQGVVDPIPLAEGLWTAEASSVTKGGLVVGYGFTDEGGILGWTATK